MEGRPWVGLTALGVMRLAPAAPTDGTRSHPTSPEQLRRVLRRRRQQQTQQTEHAPTHTCCDLLRGMWRFGKYDKPCPASDEHPAGCVATLVHFQVLGGCDAFTGTAYVSLFFLLQGAVVHFNRIMVLQTVLGCFGQPTLN